MHKGKILLVEDDRSTIILIDDTLKREKYYLRIANNLQKARNELQHSIPDLIILDRRLPDGDGIDFCREIRSNEKTKNIPILFLTAVSGISDKITGLKVGGDDYLTKPFNIDELKARVEAVLRRSKNKVETTLNIIKVKGIVLNTDSHECKVDGSTIELWPKEYELLKTFIEKKNKVLTKDFLAEYVWEHEYLTSSRAVEATIQRLRNKLGRRKNIIETVKGYGYKLKD